MHVLVTGAGGFSGAAVVVSLLGQHHRVTAVVGSKRGRLPGGADQLGDLTVVCGDLSGDLPLPLDVDAVVHAAGRSPEPGVTADDLVRDNVTVTRQLLLHAKRCGARKFISFSTVSIYGRVETPLIDEATPVLDPDLYGQTKRLSEELIAAEANSFSSLALRLPGVLGRGSGRNWLTNVLEAARAGRDISVFNPNAPFNNAVHIADLSCFVGELLDQDWTGADAVTVGAAGQIAVGDAVQLLVDAFGARSRITQRAAPKGSSMISNVRASARYGYRPMEIEEMLRRFASENLPDHV